MARRLQIAFRLMSGVLMLKNRPLGYLLAGVMLIYGTAFGLTLIAMIISMAAAGVAIAPVEVVFFVTVALIQLRHERLLGATLGANKALTILVQQDQRGTVVAIGVQDWADKITPQAIGQAVAALTDPVTLAWVAGPPPQVVTELFTFIDMHIRQQQPGVQHGLPQRIGPSIS